jgi:hypothetical protein
LLLLPIESNKYNKYSASFKDNNNYTQYNSNIETVCIEVNKRYKLNLPSGNMLYSYLTVFEIKENKTNEIVDFITTIIGPFISIFILYILGNLLKEFKDEKLKDKNKGDLNLLPIIGINELSKKYLTCQANYILPDELKSVYGGNPIIHITCGSILYDNPKRKSPPPVNSPSAFEKSIVGINDIIINSKLIAVNK